MGKKVLSETVQNAKMFVNRYTPEILMGFGIAGMLTTTVLAVKATPKAMRILDKRREEEKKKDSDFKDFTWKGVVKETWKCYIPAATTAGVSIACLVGSSSVSGRRNAVLATAYKMAETAHTKYREKVVETIGEKKEQAIKDKVIQDEINNNPVSKNQVFITEKGNTLCYDVWSGRYFKSDKTMLDKAINEINRRLLNENYVSLNDFYAEIGLGYTKQGDELGWKVEMGKNISIQCRPAMSDDDEPCLAVDFSVAPIYNYYKLA